MDEKLDINPYKEVFVGHTTTTRISDIPFEKNNVWFMDTGGGFEGKLSIMDIDTHQFWQSDKVSKLYPNHKHR
jgi:serine/threonine protein phosphatase 1